MFDDLFKDDRDPIFIDIEKQQKNKNRKTKEILDKKQLYIESFNLLTNDINSFKNSNLKNVDKNSALNNLLSFFIDDEDYSKCTILQTLIKGLN